MELGNIFELILLFCHVPSELSGEPEIPVWGLIPQVPVVCHPAVPTNLFHFWWPFLLQPAGLGLGYTVGESKLTKVLINPPPAAPNSSAACFVALSASPFPHVVGCLPFGDPNNTSPLPFQVPIQHLIESRFLPCF